MTRSNLLDLPYNQTVEVNGLTLSVDNEGLITVNGTNSKGSSFNVSNDLSTTYIANGEINSIDPGKYIFKYEPVNVPGSQYINVTIHPNSNIITDRIGNGNDSTPLIHEFTIEDDGTEHKYDFTLRLYDKTFNNYQFKLSLEKVVE